MSEQKARLLTEVDILCDLTPEEMTWLGEVTPMVSCPQGKMIYGQQDQAEVLFILKRGRVQLYRLTPEGKKLDIAVLEKGTFFGDMPILGQRMQHLFAEALTDCLICVMSRPDVERLILKHPQVALRMLNVLSDRLSEAEERLETLAFQNVPARLAATLLRLAERDTVRMTHQELAEVIGAYRETVTKTLDAFQRDALVELGRARIDLRDRPGLERVVRSG
ncbi:MAG: Crp/Fnr family transcriptional regulator [Chloroflexi bacterium]|nr:Crp/Fnr family transcriptional regulator [Chloroflexota bacterium]